MPLCRRIILVAWLVWAVSTPLGAWARTLTTRDVEVAATAQAAPIASEAAAGGVQRSTEVTRDAGMAAAHPQQSWGRYLAGCVLLGGLILGPGLWLWSRRRGDVLSLGWIPVPGVLLAAGCGLLLWISGAAKTSAAEWTCGIVGCLASLGGVVGIAGAVRRRQWEALGVLVVYVAGFGIAQALWLHPAPIATEIWPNNAFRGRMVASPPDHVIPFFTAAYMHHGKDGKESRKEYFGVEWAITSRGPLAPLVINAGFALMREHMQDPVAMPGRRWPADEEGFWVARVLGSLLNGLVVFGVLRLLSAFGVHGRGWAVAGAALLMCTPLAVLHTGFLWPKLLASYFGCLALGEALDGRRSWRVGLWLALAYLSHPVGGLLWPAVLVVAAWPDVRPALLGLDRGAWKTALVASGRLLAALFVPLIPWLLYQRWVAHPELLWNYPLGDGREWLPAASWESWWMCRWNNVCRTFVPLCFFLSDHARHYGDGLIEGGLRWALQAQFALPGALGVGLYGASVSAFFVQRWRGAATGGTVPDAPAANNREGGATRPAAWFAVTASVAVMLIYWGYGAGGLGRDCLQPVAVWIVALTAAHPMFGRVGLRWLLLSMTAAEAALVVGLGFAAAH